MYPCGICGEFWPMEEMYELEDRLATLVGSQKKKGISLDDIIPQNVVCSQELRAFFVEHI